MRTNFKWNGAFLLPTDVVSACLERESIEHKKLLLLHSTSKELYCQE